MKKLIISFIFFLCLGSINLSAQDFVKILEAGNYTELVQHFNSKVKMELNRDKKVVSKSKAIDMLENEMTSFNPTRWESMHQGSSDDDKASYLITKVYNQAGDGLRIFIHLEKGQNKKTISGIRIRKLL